MNKFQVAATIVDAVAKGEGGSISLKGERPTNGYMVGGYSWTLTVIPDMFDTYTVTDFLDAHSSILTWGNVYVGWWESKGRIYLDVSKNFRGHSQAIGEAMINQEIAIWSLDTNSEIILSEVK